MVFLVSLPAVGSPDWTSVHRDAMFGPPMGTMGYPPYGVHPGDTPYGISPVRDAPADDGDVAAVLDLLEALAQAPDVATFRRRTLAVRDLIPADIASFNEVCSSTGTVVMVASDPRLMQPDAIEAYRRLRTGHPVVAHRERTGDLIARTISQFVSEEEFRQSAIHRELFAELGILDQLIRATDRFGGKSS